MRKILTLSAVLAMAALAWAGSPVNQPVQKKALPKKPITTASASKTPARVQAKAPAARTAVGKKAATTTAAAHRRTVPVPRTSWRNRQMSPTADRYKEIQDALVARGYLSADDATGAWGPVSADALKKFQAEQTIETTGKIDSLSLIALGLGPKHDTTVPRVVDGNFVQPEYGRN
jgi:hypothetical protein